MKATVVRPSDLTAADVARWAEFQWATPDLDNPFLSAGYARAVGAVRPQARVGVLRRAGEVIGYFPFERAALGRATPLAPPLSDAQGLVHAPGLSWDATEVLRACDLGLWEFDHLVRAQEGFAPYAVRHSASPVIDLAGGFGPYLAEAGRRSSRVRDLPRRRRRLEREVGPVRFEFSSTDPTARRTLLTWKSAQYRRTGRMDRFARPWVRDLVELLSTTTDPRCTAATSLLWAGDQLVAGHLGLSSSTVLPTWFPVYDPTFARHSPGLLLHIALAEAAAGRGIPTLDLGPGAKAYKDELATGHVEVGEGRAVARRSTAAAHWAASVPGRALRHTVVNHPALYRSADGALRSAGALRARLHRTEYTP